MANKFTALTKTIIFALLGILILTVAVPTIYITVASYLNNWTTSCSLVTGVGCVAFPTNNASIASMPLAGLLQTLIPLVLGITIVMAVIGGILAMVKFNKKGR